MTEEFGHADVVVIGAGPGGYGAAFEAADLGLDVAVVDPEPNPGGVCLYRGCIPSKALLYAARVIEETRRAADWGIEFGEPEIDIAKLRQWKNEVVDKLTGGLGYLADRRNVRQIRGRARFEGPFELAIENGEEQGLLTFDHAIVATGSRARELPALSFDHPRIMSSTEALELEVLPKRLLIVGSGYIGAEMATVYAALGSDVTMVEASPYFLRTADRELVKPLQKRLGRRLDKLLLESRVVDARVGEREVEVTIVGGDVEEEELVEDFDRVLVAVGRRPNTEQLHLERTRVEVGPDRFIAVDEKRRTADRHIYAVGDVTTEPMLAHKATREGIVAARAIAGEPEVFDPRAIPAVVFTDPEIAWCGLTEKEARRQEREVAIGRFPWNASGRATTMGRRDGLTKVLADPSTHRILGVGVCGPEAGELVAEAALAMEMAARVEDLAGTIHPHPTLSETLMEAAENVFGNSTHNL